MQTSEELKAEKERLEQELKDKEALASKLGDATTETRQAERAQEKVEEEK